MIRLGFDKSSDLIHTNNFNLVAWIFSVFFCKYTNIFGSDLFRIVKFLGILGLVFSKIFRVEETNTQSSPNKFILCSLPLTLFSNVSMLTKGHLDLF